MTPPVASTDAPTAHSPEPPPVVGGRFAPIRGLRRNAVDYAESMWRRHGDLVHMVVGPPGASRDVWWLHHPDGAARVLSGSSWRAYAKRDQVPDVRESFPAVSDTIMRRGLGALRLPAGIPTRRVRRGRAAREDLFGVCEDIVAGRREGRTTGETDLLSRLIAARDGEERLSDEEVRGQVLVFMLAGHETTSTALSFALHLLGRHQDVQDRVRAEVREVVGDRHPTARDVALLPETTAALKEAMRLYPSAPILGRLSVEEDELMGHRVPPGTNVVVVPWTIHRHPDFWVDPLVFDPSRFTGAGTRPEPTHRYAWMPFGGGPRACIGQHFSMVEAVLALALILREHRVTALADTDQLPVGSLITLFPTEPVLARVERLA